jgi:ribose transport system permease protein
MRLHPTTARGAAWWNAKGIPPYAGANFRGRQVNRRKESAVSATVAARPPGQPAAWVAWVASARAWLFLALLIIGFEAWAEFADGISFIVNPYNIRSIAVFAVAPLLLAIGQTFVIISGGIDLSVGFTMGFAAVVVSNVVNAVTPQFGAGIGLLVGVVVTVAASIVPGLVNGLLIARLRVPPFIGTLGMYGVARGVAYLLAGGTTVPISNDMLSWLGNGSLGGVPVVILITAVAMLVLHYLLSQTKFGQYVYAIGGNRAAAVRAGINVRGMTIWIYVLSAICAAVGGILYTGRFSAGAAQAGEPLLLDSIAAVVIGGASLFGGSGTVIGTLIGALIVAVIQYGLVFINVEPFWQFVAVGVVIIISVLVDQSQRKGGRVDE